MTEEEARTKWCPKTVVMSYVNADGSVFSVSNRNGFTDYDIREKCLGSKCMSGVDSNGSWLGYCGLMGVK